MQFLFHLKGTFIHYSLWVFFSAATKVLIAPVVILLVVVLGALALVIGNTIIHMNTHIHSDQRQQ